MRGPVAVWVVGMFVVLALAGPSVVPHDPLATDVRVALSAPDARHWFGTDQLGRDVLSRVVVAARVDLGIAVAAVALAVVPGTLVGAWLGYRGGWPDRVGARLVDVLMAFPLYVLAMVIVAALGNTVANVIAATAIVNLAFYIRLVRAEVMLRRRAAWVEAARVSGAGEARILGVLVLPAVLPLVAVQASVNLGWAIMNAAGLSFLGLGVRPPTAEWGIMVAEGARFLGTGQWWLALFPGLFLVAAVLAFHGAGDWLRDRLGAEARI